MKPDTSHWRNRRSYQSFDTLTIEGLAWECLRRDEPYQFLYQNLIRKKAEAEPLPQDAERRWGLRFRGPTRAVRHRPAGVLVALGRSRDPDRHAATRSFAAGAVPIAPRYRRGAR